MNYRLYKDAEPQDTINKIMNILSKNRIFVEESASEGFDGVFSVRLEVDWLGLGTNGKGVSKEAALASAYAELLERIQNFGLYKFRFPAKDEVSNAKFYYAPDEKAISYSEYMECLKGLITAVNTDSVTADDLAIVHTKYERDKKVVFCVPYVNYNSGERVFIPARLSEHIYASNGMAAGNTYTEALVQSICEIFERYANKIIYEARTIPPDIQIEDINFSAGMNNVISKLTKQGNYIVKFKDCSLGLGLPVVGMYFIDKTTGKYFVKFGCHPILSIAAERTITELFQGRELSYANIWLNVFTFETNFDADVNFENIFRSGDGAYPHSIFSEAHSYEFSDCWYKEKDANNELFLNYLLEILKKNNWDLFHRDVSFLGFPSLHAFIPEISNIARVDKQYLEKQLRYKAVKNSMRQLSQCSKEEIMRIVDFIDSSFYNDFDTIQPLVGLPLSKSAPFDKTNNLCFKFLLCCKAGEYERGIKNLDRFIKENGLSLGDIALYRCVREATYALYVSRMDRSETERILHTMFHPNLVKGAMAILHDYKFDTFDCFACDSCTSKSVCRYPQIMQFDDNMSEKYLLWGR